MSKLLLLSHANLSEAFYQTIELIMGKPDDRVSYITLPYGANLEEYQTEIESKVKEARRWYLNFDRFVWGKSIYDQYKSIW